MWKLIPEPATDGRIMLALDDSINPKTGKKIFGCGYFFNHASKGNQSDYPWSQCILAIGLLKKIKSRWACLPLDFRFYLMKKDIESNQINVQRKNQPLSFESKMMQSAIMIKAIFDHFKQPVLVVADSWFGNDGLWSRLDRGCAGNFNLLSRLRCNITLYTQLDNTLKTEKQRGRPKKYGVKLGSTTECAQRYKQLAKSRSVFLYGKQRDVLVHSEIVMLKTLKCPVRVVWVFRKTQFVALMTTDLSLSIVQIIEYYGARWKIESGFKEIKQEIGSAKTQTRTADAVCNHLNFCMMATTLTWVYADRLQSAPVRKHKIRGRASFAFSDIRKIISEAALNQNFQLICPKPKKTPINSFVTLLLRMVA